MMVCRICGNGENNTRYAVPELMFGNKEQFDYFQCAACGCLQIAKIPSDLAKYYPPTYYSFTPKQRKHLKNPIERFFRQLRDEATIFPRKNSFNALISALSPNKKLVALERLDLTKDSRVLDVGCGEGWRLYALRELGFQQVEGVDPFIQADIVYDNGVIVRKKSIHELEGTWDAIMYHHSFEHLVDPIADLQQVARLLSPRGCCLIRIPTVSSQAWEQYREYWYQIDAPRHLFLHSLTSMGLLAEKAGFRVRDVVFDSTAAQFEMSEKYLRGMTFVSADRPFSRKTVRGWKQQAEKLNKEKRGDQAAFYLVKK